MSGFEGVVKMTFFGVAGVSELDRDQGEPRIAADGACLPEFETRGAQVDVHRGGHPALDRLVEQDVAGDGGFCEAGEPGAACFEGAELLEELLCRPVRVAQEVLFDASTQAFRAGGEGPSGKGVVVEMPETVQQRHEAGAVLYEVFRVNGPGQLAPRTQGYLGW
ncbi:hypothetical protein U0M97_36945 [Streptomyces venezuelae]|nr:hypothetical protein [Streptomyces gardneri]WRK41153.1 hypothetical protein U0M97_36945 [Streptomyces venezuelae]